MGSNEGTVTMDARALSWLTGRDTGVSSKTIWSVMTGHAVQRTGIPYDPDDFGRCHRLLLAIPEWRDRLDEVADAHPKWRPFVDAWGQMEALYAEESPRRVAPRLYELMRSLRGLPERGVTLIRSGNFEANITARKP